MVIIGQNQLRIAFYRSLHVSPVTVNCSQPLYFSPQAKEKRWGREREAREGGRKQSERAREVSSFSLSILSLGSTIK